MKIELTKEEIEFLSELLKERLGDIKSEIHHAMKSEFRDELKRKEKLLKILLDKLASIVQMSE